MLDFIYLHCSMFRSDVPIMTAPMIWSVAWDVMRGGWLGPTMVLWRHWRLGGTAFLVGYFSHCNVSYVIAMFLSVECDVSFLYFSPSLFGRWLDSSVLSFSYSIIVRVLSPWNVDPVLPGVELFLCVWPFSSFLKCFCFLLATFVQHCATLLKYHTPIERMSYDTIKYRTHYWRSVIRHWKSVACILEKCRTTLFQYRTPSCEVSHALREKCRPPLVKCIARFW